MRGTLKDMTPLHLLRAQFARTIQGPVQKQLRFGAAKELAMAEHICCHNTKFAEPSGFLETVNLFGQLNASGTREAGAPSASCCAPLSA
jgi:hypothetical protein